MTVEVYMEKGEGDTLAEGNITAPWTKGDWYTFTVYRDDDGTHVDISPSERSFPALEDAVLKLAASLDATGADGFHVNVNLEDTP